MGNSVYKLNNIKTSNQTKCCGKIRIWIQIQRDVQIQGQQKGKICVYGSQGTTIVGRGYLPIGLLNK